MPQNMVTHPPLSPSEIVLPTTTFVTACQPGPGQPPPFQPQRPGGPPRPNEPLPVLGELLCYDSTWYLNGLYECTEEEVPVVTSTESMVVSSTESMVDEVEKNCSEPVIAGNMTAVEHAEVATGSTFPASIVYALSALVGLLLVLLLVLSICLCQSRRNDNSTKRMKKSGFKDQLSIFKKPTPLNRPPKLPLRPSTVGSVGSNRYQEHEPPKLPGQKIAEEEAEARKIEAIRSEIYEQIGKRSDLPEYIDIYQIK
ncbi:uncharacterized protein LOC100891774 [Strongylocentrotus purpuratus]|uniref:Uncharacterized protein n=1 Tax=Strongylocentrotus purpuratus TaxID=7668 RepID=A0A7M7PGJ0_STRPU|nr:uncharacterized protein LOC100891774 [Strongylocentrotus purpuratus]